MAVESVTLVKEESGIGSQGLAGVRVYQVVCDDQADTSETARTAVGVPQYGDAWSVGSPTKVTETRAVRVEEGLLVFIVTCTYAAPASPTGGGTTNPLSEPTQYEFGADTAEEPFFIDDDGNPVVNSAGEPYQDLPTREVSRGTIGITTNVASFNDLALGALRKTINSATVTINGQTYAAGTLFMRELGASGPNIRAGVTYWVRKIKIVRDDAGWDKRIEDRGYSELSVTGQKVPILDASKKQVTTPYPLDGAGTRKPNAGDEPAVREHPPYPPASWAALGLT